MKDNILTSLFIILLITALIFLLALFAINEAESETEFGGFKEVTGTVQSFEVIHENYQRYEPTKKITERYDDKLIDYKDHIEDRRDETFFR